MPDTIEQVPIGDLTAYEHNARTHSDEQVAQLAASITEWGWTNPVLINADNGIIAGHGRVLAAEQLGMETVPCIRVVGLTPDQERALILADNKLALNAGWDETTLIAELRAIADSGYELGPIGFDAEELSHLFRTIDGATDPDEEEEPPENPASVLGDMWLLGDHRIICGSSTDPETVKALLRDDVPLLMVTDPPYGVVYDAAWRGKAKRSDGKRTSLGVHAKGKVLNDDNADWSAAWALFPGDVAYVWHAGNMAHVVAQSLIGEGLEIRAQIIWNKSNMVIGRGDYHPKHEPCWYAVRKGRPGHYVGGRKQTTVWDIAKPMRSETGHSTQKPIECMRIPIENNSKAGDHVYEPFSGSGTTIIAGEQTGRKVLAVELNPAYVDLAVTRWEKFTAKTATLASTGQSFAEVLAERVPA